MEKDVFVTDVTIRKCVKKYFVTIKKIFFCGKRFRDFFCCYFMTTNDNVKSLKSQNKYCCKICHFYTSRSDHYSRHLSTTKHLKTTIMTTNDNKNGSESHIKKYACNNCDKTFNDRSGLWRHKKKCNKSITDYSNNFVIDKEFVMMIIKQNAELQTNVIELMKKGTHNTISQNNNNKTFNLQFFLNETCKDAMNIMDFVDSIKPTLEDLENTGKVGYVEGISKIIVDNLKELETCERPIHCSNIKKEVLYIKDQDKWTQEKPVLTKAIHTIANKNINNINEWKEENPGCKDSDSKKNDAYLHIVMNSMAGSSPEESSNNMNKIIAKVAKEVVIEK